MKKLTNLLLLASMVLLSSCDQESGRRIFQNKYNTYNEMAADMHAFQSVYKEPEPLLFNPVMENIISYNYTIAGIDYSNMKPDDVYCNDLRNREAYIEGFFELNSKVIIIFLDKVDFDKESLHWVNSDGGNTYRYELDYNKDAQFFLKDNNDKQVLGLKFKNCNQEIKNLAFDYCLDQIMLLSAS